MRVVAALTQRSLFVAVFRMHFRLYAGSLMVTQIHIRGVARRGQRHGRLEDSMASIFPAYFVST